MLNLHCYRDIFGKPGEGFHSARFLGLARNDLLGVVFIAVIIGFATGCIAWALFSFLMIWFVGVIAHLLFGVATPVSAPLAKLLDISLDDLRGCSTITNSNSGSTGGTSGVSTSPSGESAASGANKKS